MIDGYLQHQTAQKIVESKIEARSVNAGLKMALNFQSQLSLTIITAANFGLQSI